MDSYSYIYTWNPNDPCFDWKGPCFGGLTFKNRGHWGSRYIYIYLVVLMYCYFLVLVTKNALRNIRETSRNQGIITYPLPAGTFWVDDFPLTKSRSEQWKKMPSCLVFFLAWNPTQFKFLDCFINHLWIIQDPYFSQPGWLMARLKWRYRGFY